MKRIGAKGERASGVIVCQVLGPEKVLCSVWESGQCEGQNPRDETCLDFFSTVHLGRN